MPAPLRFVQNDINLPDSADVVIIGAGIAGASACWELTFAGLKVVILEKGFVGAEQSSRNWGWCRQQNRDERELPLIKHALTRWPELTKLTGEELGFRQTGLVYATRDESEIASWEKWRDMARQYDVKSHILDATQAKSMTPGSVSDWIGGVHSPDDGHADPGLAAPGLIIDAQRRGAMVFQQCAVRGLDISAGKISGVITERGMIKTQSVVCSAGAWTSIFCRRHGISLPAANIVGAALRTHPAQQMFDAPFYSKTVSWRPRIDGGYTIALSGRGRMEPGFQTIKYAKDFLPLFKSRRKSLKLSVKLKASSFLNGPESIANWSFDGITPFEKTRTLDPLPQNGMDNDAIAALVQEFPDLKNIRIAQSWGGVIDFTPDDVPIISTIEKIPGLVIACGFSGHGFGLGPGTGRLVADLIMGSTPIVDPTPYRYSRFFDGTKNQESGLM